MNKITKNYQNRKKNYNKIQLKTRKIKNDNFTI